MTWKKPSNRLFLLKKGIDRMEKAKTISITVSRETLDILDRIVLLTDKTRSAVIRDMVKESWIDYCRKQGGLFE